MLTKQLAIADYDKGRVLPDRLSRKSHAQYTACAERMLQIYRRGIGRTRRDLHLAVHAVLAEEVDCPGRRIDAFCKLLDDVSTFAKGRHGQAAALRKQIFRQAAPLHPLVSSADRLCKHTEATAKALIAAELGRSWEEIDQQLYADVPECHRLEAFRGYASGAALLARYNVAQVQVALFRAVEMIIWATADFKIILRYAKLAGLMHTIRKLSEGRYEIRLDGPASVLRGTHRYGVAMAKFLPALIACRGWRMHAVLQTRRAGCLISLDLSPDDHLTSHLPAPEEFDSRVEEQFAKRWGDQREGWSLHREGEILHQGQKVFVPDFVLRHEDGRAVLLEIVGFWTPEYLQAKLQTLRAFQDHKILVAAAKPASRHIADLPAETIHYKTALRPEAVLAQLRESI
jgi:predicted nuclease of restriction endonuclease-like RecB superfamily